MKKEFEGLKFSLPSSTLLIGPMAAAKPLFAQKFIARILNENHNFRVNIFATSSPMEGILRNLKAFGLGEKNAEKIVFFDYNPGEEKFLKVKDAYYTGNFSDEGQLKEALSYADKNTIVLIPSFTLLLVGTQDKMKLTKALIDNLFKRRITSFVAVNSEMFRDANRELEKVADNVISFIKREERVYFKVVKFKGDVPREEHPFDFPRELFQRTKKEVAERTSKMIREKKKKI